MTRAEVAKIMRLLLIATFLADFVAYLAEKTRGLKTRKR
jgi:hypothetical protein